MIKSPSHIELSHPVGIEPEVDKETRLKAWKEKLKNQNDQENKSTRRYRNQTGISSNDVELAMKLSKEHSKNVSSTYITPEPIKVKFDDHKSVQIHKCFIFSGDIRKNRYPFTQNQRTRQR